jgi:hypothetical protein
MRRRLAARGTGSCCVETVTIPREIINDLDNNHDRSVIGRKNIIQNGLPFVLGVVEQTLSDVSSVPSRIVLTHGAISPGAF